jgi:hypothetical protein
MDKFNTIYKNIIAEASQKDKEFQKKKLWEATMERFYEVKDEIVDKIFSEEAEEAVNDQLNYYWQDEMYGKKFGKILYPADDIDNFDKFEFTEKDDERIKNFIYKCIGKHFMSMFIEHELM